MELIQQQQVVHVPVPTAEVLVSSLHYLEKKVYARFMILYCIVYMLYLCYIAVKVQTYDIQAPACNKFCYVG